MGRPTIALCMIVKNEVMNLPKLMASVKDCFDEIHLTDTGSTDGTIELITKWHHKNDNPAGADIYLHGFNWVNDFSKARNFSFSTSQCDYLMWMDGDDVLNGREEFIAWRDHVMAASPVWMATYRYALDADTKRSLCSFARERVIKRSMKHEWKYFVHEGLVVSNEDGTPAQAQYATSWTIDHLRGPEDMKKDVSRNLDLFEKHKDNLDSRMTYYYGKELFENKRAKEGYEWLMKAAKDKTLVLHDRILCLQYAAQAALQCEGYDECIALCHAGLQLDPNRAEFMCLLSDGYLKKNQLVNAIPYLHAAKNAISPGNEARMVGPVFVHEAAYSVYPTNNLARIYMNLGDVERARAMAEEGVRRWGDKESSELLKAIEQTASQLHPSAATLTPSTDIWITCHPTGFYEWDEEIAKERGIGGSETAVVQMARELHKQTGRKVMVFNNRTAIKDCGGVVYLPAEEMRKFAGTVLPAVHIAWRHNMQLTPAPTYVWCHDLSFPGLEFTDRYEKLFVLSNFHKNYVKGICGIPDEKMWVTRNGIDPSRFEVGAVDKDPNKVIFSSSPDRGLKEAILVMDRVRKEIPEATLHVYYGFDNMLKMGRDAEVKALQAMCLDRSWVKYHGNTEQKALAIEHMSASVWLYPTWFQETFFIGGLEMQLARVYGVLRSWGAIPERIIDGNADVLDIPCETDEHRAIYAERVVFALREEKWRGVHANASALSWESVAREWVEYLGLSR